MGMWSGEYAVDGEKDGRKLRWSISYIVVLVLKERCCAPPPPPPFRVLRKSGSPDRTARPLGGERIRCGALRARASPERALVGVCVRADSWKSVGEGAGGG